MTVGCDCCDCYNCCNVSSTIRFDSIMAEARELTCSSLQLQCCGGAIRITYCYSVEKLWEGGGVLVICW